MNKKEVIVIQNLESWYEEAHILHGINLTVREGECVALLGRNGAGRTTILKSIMGLIAKRRGSIHVNDMETIRMSTNQIAHLGIGYCPEERGIFASLSCEENLCLPQKLGNQPMTEQEIYTMFPALKERAKAAGTKLSGGEQQMLAIARILYAGAPILLLDEISEGLAPIIVQMLVKTIHQLKASGHTILLVEQNLSFAAKLADRMYVIERGRIVEELQHQDLEDKKSAIEALLGV